MSFDGTEHQPQSAANIDIARGVGSLGLCGDEVAAQAEEDERRCRRRPHGLIA